MNDIAVNEVPDILLCIDRSFILGAGALIVSLVKNNNGVRLRVHVCAPRKDLDKVRELLFERIFKLFKEDAPKLFLYASEDFTGFTAIEKEFNHRCAMQCVRLLAVDAVQCFGRHLLYLDVDMLCLKPLSLLLGQYPCNGEVLSASEEKGHQEQVCGVNISRYFISGILLIDLKEWRKLNVGRESIACAIKHHPKYPDQDALNATLQGQWHCFDNGIQGFWEERKNTIFVHFVGSKPWLPWSFFHRPHLSALFREYAKLIEPNVTRWISFRKNKDALINLSDSRYATKWMAKKLWKRGHLKGALYFYLKHYIVKIRQKGLLGLILMCSNTRS